MLETSAEREDRLERESLHRTIVGWSAPDVDHVLAYLRDQWYDLRAYERCAGGFRITNDFSFPRTSNKVIEDTLSRNLIFVSWYKNVSIWLPEQCVLDPSRITEITDDCVGYSLVGHYVDGVTIPLHVYNDVVNGNKSSVVHYNRDRYSRDRPCI